MIGPTEVLLWGSVIAELAEGVSRIVEIAQRMQRGEPVTKEDLVAARQRTDEALARLEAAIPSDS